MNIQAIESLCRSSSPHILEIGDWTVSYNGDQEILNYQSDEKSYPLLPEEEIYISSPTSTTKLKETLFNECISSTGIVDLPNTMENISPLYDAKRALELLEQAALNIKSSSSSSSSTTTTSSSSSSSISNSLKTKMEEIPKRFKRIPLQDITNTNRTVSIFNGKLRHMKQENLGESTTETSQIRFMEPKHSQDLYSPRWVRGKGFTREGLCHFCHGGINSIPTEEDCLLILKNSIKNPSIWTATTTATALLESNWYRIKQSAFWYHLHFHHGISAKRGEKYPTINYETLRIMPLMSKYGIPNENLKKCQVFCSNCNEYITIWQQKSTTQIQSLAPEDLITKLPVLQNWWKHCQRRHQ